MRGANRKQRPVLIVGEESSLKQTLEAACRQRYLAYHMVDGPDAGAGEVEALLWKLEPWAVIDLRSLAGSESRQSRKVVTSGSLAAQCAEHDVAYLLWSVGDHDQASSADALVIRTEPGLIGVEQVVVAARRAQQATATPRGVSLLSGTALEAVHDALDLLVDGAQGVWRLPYTGTAGSVAA